MSWKALVETLKPASGHIALFFSGAVVGGVLFSRNFTIQKGDFLFSTHEDKVCLSKLQDTYALRVKNLKVWSFYCICNCAPLPVLSLQPERLQDKSAASLKEFNGSSDPARKRAILTKVVSHYLSPTSQDRIFGADLVIYNGKGKPTIMQRDEFDRDIAENWKKVLVSAGVKDCVDTFRIGTPDSAYHEPSVRQALQLCTERAEQPPRVPPAHTPLS
jgi:hypothetical protein